ncbi:alpha/beta fold hydrolase, partial [Streptococcus suis]
IKVPVCWISSGDRRPGAPTNDAEEFAARMRVIPNLMHVPIADTGHNLHHDAPGAVAAAIEAFLSSNAANGSGGGAERGKNLQ